MLKTVAAIFLNNNPDSEKYWQWQSTELDKISDHMPNLIIIYVVNKKKKKTEVRNTKNFNKNFYKKVLKEMKSVDLFCVDLFCV